jgi:hypothetical protein
MTSRIGWSVSVVHAGSGRTCRNQPERSFDGPVFLFRRVRDRPFVSGKYAHVGLLQRVSAGNCRLAPTYVNWNGRGNREGRQVPGREGSSFARLVAGQQSIDMSVFFTHLADASTPVGNYLYVL